jgi:hypothetical protein
VSGIPKHGSKNGNTDRAIASGGAFAFFAYSAKEY